MTAMAQEDRVLAKSTIDIDGENIDIFVHVEGASSQSEWDDERGDESTKVISATVDMLADAMKLVRVCAFRAVQSIKSINEESRPDEWEVKMAVKLDSKVGAFIAEVNAGAQLEVTMKWKEKS